MGTRPANSQLMILIAVKVADRDGTSVSMLLMLNFLLRVLAWQESLRSLEIWKQAVP